MPQDYDITLKISYLYDSPAAASRTLLRMLPRTEPGQQLLAGVVTADPAPGWRRDATDFFGNATTEIAHEARLTRIVFRFDGRVRRALDSGALDLSCGLPALAQQVAALRDIGASSPHHFLGASPRIPADPAIAAFARACIRPDMSAQAAVQAVSRALHGHFTFDPTATDVATPPAQAFRARRGVCQDMAQVMICALRALGIPAGYVSGFLRTLPPEGRPRLEGADAMHAWVRAWCGADAGWIGIDPTNDMAAGGDHITVAFGRDYADVAPIRGALRSAGRHRTTHQVDVIPV